MWDRSYQTHWQSCSVVYSAAVAEEESGVEVEVEAEAEAASEADERAETWVGVALAQRPEKPEVL